ncbi:MAG TPA: branched-chain amino acid ABC transporter permease [Candidatus Nanopelagicales bacterium]|nr:branched-chain amino acid ABC transporter permease [Candidatus Nanopelagicales bacterium]
MRRLLLGISAVALALWALLVGGAPAMAADTTIGGVIKSDQEAVPGVTVNVSDETGFVENAISDEKGRWRVVVPQAGTYTVLIETDTLPPGVSLRDPDRTSVEVTVGEGQTKSVLFPTGDAPVSSTSKLDQALQLTVDGFIFGLTIALAAVGLSLIFGTTGLTNFSHGELVTFGSLMAYFFSAIMGLPFIVAAAAAVFAGGLFGFLQDRFFWRWLRKRGTALIAMLVVSIGLGIFLRYFYLFIFGGNTRQYAEYSGQAGLVLGPIVVTPKALVGAIVAVVFLAATVAWLRFTRMGKASRAIADNPALASASGIDVNRVISIIWAAGAGLAALAGVIYSLSNGVSWISGFGLLLLIFAGVTLGGLGTAIGAIVGSIIVGTMIQLSTLLIPSELKNVGALAVLIIILMIRPQGILGRSERVG